MGLGFGLGLGEDDGKAFSGAPVKRPCVAKAKTRLAPRALRAVGGKVSRAAGVRKKESECVRKKVSA